MDANGKDKTFGKKHSRVKEQFRVIETHISWVFLTGQYAYKIKKPIQFAFVDFSTLEKRHFYCDEELRLNKVLAKELYISVVPVFGAISNPVFETPSFQTPYQTPTFQTPNLDTKPIEYAVKMYEFEQSDLLSNFIKKFPNQSICRPVENIMRMIANQMAVFHSQTRRTPLNTPYASKEKIRAYLLDNFNTLKNFKFLEKSLAQKNLTKVEQIEGWSIKTLEEYGAIFEKRKSDGFIRECHGDLHLNNIIYTNRKITIFDCIEFNEDFRNIDCIDEMAFLIMDLKSQGYFIAAFQLLNQYLKKTEDYEGLLLLRFYEVYRAMVRAKVALLNNDFEQCEHYLDLALRTLHPTLSASVPFLMITYGLPGSGKSYLSRKVASVFEAIHLQSDVERKHLFKDRDTDSNALYSSENKDKVYQHLMQLAERLLQAAIPVIVDASFVKHLHRQWFLQLAKKLNCPFLILNCATDIPILKERVKRRKEKHSYSDADEVVLDKLILQQEALTPEELSFTIQAPPNQEDHLLRLILDKLRI